MEFDKQKGQKGVRRIRGTRRERQASKNRPFSADIYSIVLCLNLLKGSFIYISEEVL
jgi:hypothetical protein